MNDWGEPVCTRNEYAAQIWTRRFASWCGMELADGREFVVVCSPDGEPVATAIEFERLANVAEFLREVPPHSSAVQCVKEENHDAIADALLAMVNSGAALQ
jgi:hypothetical protein